MTKLEKVLNGAKATYADGVIVLAVDFRHVLGDDGDSILIFYDTLNFDGDEVLIPYFMSVHEFNIDVELVNSTDFDAFKATLNKLEQVNKEIFEELKQELNKLSND